MQKVLKKVREQATLAGAIQTIRKVSSYSPAIDKKLVSLVEAMAAEKPTSQDRAEFRCGVASYFKCEPEFHKGLCGVSEQSGNSSEPLPVAAGMADRYPQKPSSNGGIDLDGLETLICG